MTPLPGIPDSPGPGVQVFAWLLLFACVAIGVAAVFN